MSIIMSILLCTMVITIMVITITCIRKLSGKCLQFLLEHVEQLNLKYLSPCRTILSPEKNLHLLHAIMAQLQAPEREVKSPNRWPNSSCRVWLPVDEKGGRHGTPTSARTESTRENGFVSLRGHAYFRLGLVPVNYLMRDPGPDAFFTILCGPDLIKMEKLKGYGVKRHDFDAL